MLQACWMRDEKVASWTHTSMIQRGLRRPLLFLKRSWRNANGQCLFKATLNIASRLLPGL